MAKTVGEKGQIVIEKPLRDALGVRPGFVVVQTLISDHVEIRFFPPEHNRSLRGVLADPNHRSISTDELRKAREIAWTESARDGWKKGRSGE